MKQTTKALSLLMILGSLAACQSNTVSLNDPTLKRMIDSTVKVHVVMEVQAAMRQYAERQQDNSAYRRIAREEGEKAAGRAAQERQSQDDAILNSQH